MPTWEIDRAREPALRWLCAVCYVPSAEHHRPWWACVGRWLDVAWQAKLYRDHRASWTIARLFAPGPP